MFCLISLFLFWHYNITFSLFCIAVIVNLEGSGKWPDDIEAIKRVKAAFHLKIAELVKSQLSLIAVPFTTHLDIFKVSILVLWPSVIVMVIILFVNYAVKMHFLPSQI